MGKKGLITLLVFTLLVSSSFVFASNSNSNFILEEIDSDDSSHSFNWELKDDLKIGACITLDLDFPLEEYELEKDNFIEVEIGENSKQVKLVFTEDLEKGEKGLISFIKKEEDIEKADLLLAEKKNTCPICDKKLEVIDDGRAVCICEEAVIIDFDDMPLKGDEKEKIDEELANQVGSDRDKDKDNIETNIDKKEEDSDSHEEEVDKDIILDENTESLPNTGLGKSYLYLGIIVLVIGLYYKKKLILK